MKSYVAMKSKIPPKDLQKREKFYLNKFKKYNQQIVETINERCDNIDAFLNEIDNNISSTRAIFRGIDNNIDNIESHQEQQKGNLKGVHTLQKMCELTEMI